ncbi:hypothetical protein RND81_11G221700 [Saponaria officinalis]|uniref:Zinc-finger domain-containing protein n=1 Tax=Saponaria officinalis TaxID=3572 RepID=A0AAW1HRI6_SAPOF
MAITRKTTTIQQHSTPLPHPQTNPNNEQTQSIPEKSTTTTSTVAADYEQTRELRIKENRDRLMKLGIVDLSLQLKSISSTPRRTPKYERKTPLKSPNSVSSEPRRRSSRLQNAPPVTYVEVKEDKSRRRQDIVLEEGAKPEFYTEEHEKLLGNTEMPWTFFVDGYAADGTRIYDSVQGKTCHQCRQKTLGQRTRCCKCNLVQGQFCGDCLYMRYGEHVVEANQNPKWICPPCRGICNCSLCRQHRGWAPTGALYKRISKLGYKSVAHYLIQTKRAPPADAISDTQQPAKRSLPFEGMEVPGEDCVDDLSGDTKTEITVHSESNSTLDIDPIQTPNGRRSSKRINKENADKGEKSAMIADVAEDAPVPDNKSAEAIERPNKRCKTENVDSDEEIVSKHVTEISPIPELTVVC